MKNKALSIILISFLGAFLFGTTITAFVLAKKTPDTIYISTEDELFSISEKLDGYYSLACDIQVTKPWSPLGTKDKPFTGTLKGNYKTITFNQSSLDYFDSGDELCWGFFGYNEGTILRTNFYGIQLNGDIDKPFNFGAFAVNNYGDITSCTLKNSDIKFSAPSVNFGAFVCNNYGDIRNCHLKTNFIIDVNSGRNLAGGLCGFMADGNIEYCSTSSSTYLTINASNGTKEVYLGNAIGLLEGGTISNCFLTSASTTIKGNDCFSSIGVVSGCFRAEKDTRITELYLVLKSYINLTGNKKVEANGMFGHVEENKYLTAENLLFDAYANFTVDDECTSESNITFTNSGPITNSYFLDHSTNAKSKNSDGAVFIDKSQLSLKLLNWDEAIWSIKNGEVTFLKTL